MPSTFSRRSCLRLGGAAMAASVLSGSRLSAFAQGNIGFLNYLWKIPIEFMRIKLS